MIAVIFWLLGLATIIVQTSLLQGLPAWFGRPDFLFILFVFIAYRFAWIPGIIVIFSLSWMMDVVSGIHLGFYPLVCLFLFTILKSLAHKNPVKESTYQIPLLGAAYLTSQFLLHMIYSFGLQQIMPDWQWGQRLQDVILLMIVAIPMFTLYNALFQLLIRRQLQKKPSRRTPRNTRRPIKPVR